MDHYSKLIVLDYSITDMRESTGRPESLKEVYISNRGETKLFEFQFIPPITGKEGGIEKINDIKLQDN